MKLNSSCVAGELYCEKGVSFMTEAIFASARFVFICNQCVDICLHGKKWFLIISDILPAASAEIHARNKTASIGEENLGGKIFIHLQDPFVIFKQMLS